MLKYIIIFIFSVSITLAQTKGELLVDDLEKALSETEDSYSRLIIISKLAQILDDINPREAIRYSKDGINLSIILNDSLNLARNYYSLADSYSKLKILDSNLLFINKSIDICLNLKNDSLLADTYTNKGVYFEYAGYKDSAIKYHRMSLELAEQIPNEKSIATSLTNIGNTYFRFNDYENALKYYLESLELDLEYQNKLGLIYSYQNIGTIYNTQGANNTALKYFEKSYELAKEVGNPRLLAGTLGLLGGIHYDLKNYQRSLYFFLESEKIETQVNDPISLGNLYNNLAGSYLMISNYDSAISYYERAYSKLKASNVLFGEAIILGNLGELYLKMASDSTFNSVESNLLNYLQLNKDKHLKFAIDYFEKSILISEEINEFDSRLRCIIGLAKTYENLNNYKKAYFYLGEFLKKQSEKEFQNQEVAIAELLAVKEKEIAEDNAKILESKNGQLYLLLVIAIIGIILAIYFIYYAIKQRNKSERLLLNILPQKFAKRLKEKKTILAEDIKDATTIFIDIVNFTEYSHGKTAKQLYKFLNNVFSEIDQLVLKYNLEKVKTMGDGYMVASGVPSYKKDSHHDAINFSLELLEHFKNFNYENNEKIQFRIGIEQGDVSSGVIGEMKFIYDIWGESVNLASRLEVTSDPDKIQISSNIAEKIMNNYKLIKREPIFMKGFGEVQTYFIEHKII
jgi:class 3 adenylate cyclase/tetratricopeptide (TPR) repeat protein